MEAYVVMNGMNPAEMFRSEPKAKAWINLQAADGYHILPCFIGSDADGALGVYRRSTRAGAGAVFMFPLVEPSLVEA